MHCKYCGKELADGSAFCNFCGKPQKDTVQPASPAKSSNPPSPSTPDKGSLKCPHCGSTHLQFTTKVKTQGVSVGDACCGYVCLGPAGLLCGLCGAGSTESKDYWVCCDCGTKFTTEEAKDAVEKKLQEEQDLAKKQREKEAQLANWRTMMENCPYPPEQLEDLYAAAVKEEEAKDKKFRNCRDEERKSIGAWQAADYGMSAGVVILIIAAILLLLSLLAGTSWILAILCGIIGSAVFCVFSNQDNKMFEMYAGSELRALKQEKEDATQHKNELKKYLEAYQGIKAEGASTSKKDS